MTEDKIKTAYLSRYCEKLSDVVVAKQLENKYEAFEKRLEEIKNKERGVS